MRDNDDVFVSPLRRRDAALMGVEMDDDGNIYYECALCGLMSTDEDEFMAIDGERVCKNCAGEDK